MATDTPLPPALFRDVYLTHDTQDIERADLEIVAKWMSASPTGAPRSLSGVEAAGALRYVRRARMRAANLRSKIGSLRADEKALLSSMGLLSDLSYLTDLAPAAGE
jgi:hypothetical protein